MTSCIALAEFTLILYHISSTLFQTVALPYSPAGLGIGIIIIIIVTVIVIVMVVVILHLRRYTGITLIYNQVFTSHILRISSSMAWKQGCLHLTCTHSVPIRRNFRSTICCTVILLVSYISIENKKAVLHPDSGHSRRRLVVKLLWEISTKEICV